MGAVAAGSPRAAQHTAARSSSRTRALIGAVVSVNSAGLQVCVCVCVCVRERVCV